MATQPTSQAPAESAEWAREKTTTAITGIGRPTLRTLRRKKKIRTASLKDEGDKRGIVLYNLDSVRAYIASMEEKAEAATGAGVAQ